MHILAIETTGKYGSVALINEEKAILAHESTKDEMNHLTGLMPMIKKILDDAGVKGEALDAIACDIGPGSFTGIRIGVSTARALAQAWGVRMIAVKGLSSFLHRQRDEWLKELSTENVCLSGLKNIDRDNQTSSDYALCAIYNARRHQVYGFIDRYMSEGPWMIEDILDTIMKDVTQDIVVMFGDGVDAYEDIIISGLKDSGKTVLFAPQEYRYQDAIQIAMAGLEKYEKGESIDYYEMKPDYMRQAEAEQKLKAGELPICKGPKQE